MVGKDLILRWVLRKENAGLLKCGSGEETLASCEQSNKSLVSIRGGRGGSGISSEASGYSSLRALHREILQSSLKTNFSLTCPPVKFISKSVFNCFLSC